MPAELLLSVVLFAAQSAAQPDMQTTPPPDPELLEFLGSFATEEGDWVDPLLLAEVEPETLDQAAQDETEATDAAIDETTQPATNGGGEEP